MEPSHQYSSSSQHQNQHQYNHSQSAYHHLPEPPTSAASSSGSFSALGISYPATHGERYPPLLEGINSSRIAGLGLPLSLPLPYPPHPQSSHQRLTDRLPSILQQTSPILPHQQILYPSSSVPPPQSANSSSNYSYHYSTPFYPPQNRSVLSPLEQPPSSDSGIDFGFDRTPRQADRYHRSVIVDTPIAFRGEHHQRQQPGDISPRSHYPILSPNIPHHFQEDQSRPSFSQYPHQQNPSRFAINASPNLIPPPTASSSTFAAPRRPSDQISYGVPSPNLGINIPLPLITQSRRGSHLGPNVESVFAGQISPQVFTPSLPPPLPLSTSSSSSHSSLQAWRNDLSNSAYDLSNSTGSTISFASVPRQTHSRNHSGESIWSSVGGWQVPAAPGSSHGGYRSQPHPDLPPSSSSSSRYLAEDLRRSSFASTINQQQQQQDLPLSSSGFHFPQTTTTSSLNLSNGNGSPYIPSPIQSPLVPSAVSPNPFAYTQHFDNVNNMPPRRSTNTTSASGSIGMGAGGASHGNNNNEGYIPPPVPAGPTTRSRVARGLAAGSLHPYPESNRGSVMSIGSSLQNRAMSGISQGSRYNVNGAGGERDHAGPSSSNNGNGGYAEPRPPTGGSGSGSGSTGNYNLANVNGTVRAIAGRSGLNHGQVSYRPVGQPSQQQQQGYNQAGPRNLNNNNNSSSYRSTGERVPNSNGRDQSILEIVSSEDELDVVLAPQRAQSTSSRAGGALKRKAGDGSAAGKRRRLDSGAELGGTGTGGSGGYDVDAYGAGPSRGNGSAYRNNGTAGVSVCLFALAASICPTRANKR